MPFGGLKNHKIRRCGGETLRFAQHEGKTYGFSSHILFLFAPNILLHAIYFNVEREFVMNKRHLLGHSMALFVAILWGTTFIFTKLLLEVYHPVEIMIFRTIIAWVVLFLWDRKFIKPKSLKDELPFILAGLTGITLYFVCENFALSYTFVANVSIIISAAPMFTALLLWLMRMTKRPSKKFFLGFVLAMGGIVMISLASGDQVGISPIGDFLTLGAALAWGLYGICIERTKNLGYTDLQVTRKVFVWGFIFSLPLIPTMGLSLSLAPLFDPMVLFQLLFLGLGASALCFVLWNKAVLFIGPLATNVYVYLLPVIALIATQIFMPEPVNLAVAVGAIALILVGLVLSQPKR